MAGGTLIEEPADPPVSEAPARRGEYRCECGHILRVFGSGRHRIYFEPGNVAVGDPVTNRVCSQCGRGLPGKNQA